MVYSPILALSLKSILRKDSKTNEIKNNLWDNLILRLKACSCLRE